jgi:hypothetical protein
MHIRVSGDHFSTLSSSRQGCRRHSVEENLRRPLGAEVQESCTNDLAWLDRGVLSDVKWQGGIKPIRAEARRVAANLGKEESRLYLGSFRGKKSNKSLQVDCL